MFVLAFNLSPWGSFWDSGGRFINLYYNIVHDVYDVYFQKKMAHVYVLDKQYTCMIRNSRFIFTTILCSIEN